MEKVNLRKWIENFKKGLYNASDIKTQMNAGWYDCFCKHSLLAAKTQKIGNILKDIEDDYILDNFYVWFKNNCPCVGPLYDDIRFERIGEDRGNRNEKARKPSEYFVIVMDDKREPSKYCIWTGRNGKNEYECKNKKELLDSISDLSASFRGQQWVNLGDVNFLAYGGSLVRPHWSKAELKEYPNLASDYDVFNLITEAGDNGNKLSARLFCVDINDVINNADNKKEILTLIGLEDKADMPADQIMSPENWAREMVEDGMMTSDPATFKTQYPGSWEDTYISIKNLKSWLKSLGAGKFI